MTCTGGCFKLNGAQRFYKIYLDCPCVLNPCVCCGDGQPQWVHLHFEGLCQSCRWFGGHCCTERKIAENEKELATGRGVKWCQKCYRENLTKEEVEKWPSAVFKDRCCPNKMPCC
jgi:hypothetical protein